jgi:large subunit ribosomal protein L3
VPGHEGTFVEIRDAVKKALPENAPKSGSFKAPEKLTAGGEG